MTIQTVTATLAKKWIDAGEAILIDVREPAEHASESIIGATLVPLGTLAPETLPSHQGTKVIVHCRKGGRGGRACEALAALPEVYNLEGGIEAWSQAGLPIKSGTRKILPLDRQVQLTIGLITLTSSLMAYFVNPAFFLVTAAIGAGLTIAGLTGFCGLMYLLARMPWNQSEKSAKTSCSLR